MSHRRISKSEPEDLPTEEEAEGILEEASRLNPGPWIEHSQNAARAARAIAERHPELNVKAAYTMGLLHDIGRREGVSDMQHVVGGYRFLRSEGYESAARVCMTHSFPVPDIGCYSGSNDCSVEETDFISGFLDGCKYTWYDRLIQFCDHIALPTGCCLLEKRMVDVVIRYGPNSCTVDKWKAIFAIRDELEACIGKSVYAVLPGVVKATFGTDEVCQ